MAPAPGTPLGGERPRQRPPDDGAGADAMEVDQGSPTVPRRFFCPVSGCPCADVTSARGWTSDSTLRAHVDAHLGGSLLGRVPPAWLQDRGLQQCLVCGLSVSTRFGTHPTCRPAAIGLLAAEGALGLEMVTALCHPCLRSSAVTLPLFGMSHLAPVMPGGKP